jgi:hypothetical protein
MFYPLGGMSMTSKLLQQPARLLWYGRQRI